MLYGKTRVRGLHSEQMERCLQCNSTLKSDEKECWGCGASVPEKNPKKAFSDRFKSIVNVLFILFVALTALSLFTDYVPGFWKCFAGMLVLYLVKNSADHMVASKKS